MIITFVSSAKGIMDYEITHTCFIYRLPDGSYTEKRVLKKDRHLYPTLSHEEIQEAYKTGKWTDNDN